MALVRQKLRCCCHSSLPLLLICFTFAIAQDTTQILVARQLYPLTSYKDVQLFRYNVPEESTFAQWTLWSNGTRNCDPVQIKFHLRWKGYPLLNVNNASISDNYLFKEREQYQLKLQSDTKPVELNITNPLPGDWFGLAYISQIDDRIVQKGLFRKCQAWLSSSLTFNRIPAASDGQRAITITPDKPINQQLSDPQYYRFYAESTCTAARVSVTQCKVVSKSGDAESSCPLHLYFRPSGLPSSNRFTRISDCTEDHLSQDACHLSDLIVSRDGWNYLLLDPIKSSSRGSAKIELQLLLTTEDCTMRTIETLTKEVTEQPTTVQIASNDTTTSTTTTTAQSITLEEIVSSVTSTEQAITTTRDVDVDELIEMTHSSTPSILTDVIREPELDSEPKPQPPYTLALPMTARLRHGPHHLFAAINNSTSSTYMCPTKLSLIRYNTQGNFAFKYEFPSPGVETVNLTQQTQPTIMDIANSHPNESRLTQIDFEITPILDSGGTLSIDLNIADTTNTTYHNISVHLCLEHAHSSLTLGFNCLKQIQVNTSLVDARSASVYVPFPRSGLWFITLRSSCYFHDRLTEGYQETHPVACEFNSTAISLSVKSSACISSLCSLHGKCNQYVTGGLIFSTCLCKQGWKGWSCEDGSQVDPDEKLLLNFLLLTLSNLMFLPSVILAVFRGHYTEALVYTVTMVSSGLYHACDSQCDRAFCLVNLNILQFGDFYSAMLAFWVTLVSLGNLPNKLKTFLHTFGGIFIAFAVEYDRTSLWAFAVPSGIGATIMLIGWLTQCIVKRSCYPSSKHWACSILPGIALSIGGLVVYAGFETRDNYAITHSIWHGSMAVALMFLVPTIRRDKRRAKEELRATAHHYSSNRNRLSQVEWRPNTSFKFLRDDIDML